MKKRKIHCLNSISPVGLDLFRKGYSITDKIEESAGILVRSANMLDMDFPRDLRAVARAGAGVNNIPLERCAEQGIVVFNTPGANANSVKELVLTALLLSSRNILEATEWIKANKDDENIAKTVEKAKSKFKGSEIKGKSLGVIGLGAIGVLVCNMAIELGMNVYGYDPFVSLKSAWNLHPKVKYVDNLNKLCSQCDFVTIHVPAVEATKNMIDAKLISNMKQGVRFLNFSRDSLVDEVAMGKALSEGKVAKYITDFANPLSVHFENAIVFPHLGASTNEAEDNCAKMAVQQLQDYLDNGNISNSVNFPTIDAGICTSEARVAILHRNIPNMLSLITAFFGKNELNIEKLVNESRDGYAYTLIDLSMPMPRDTVATLQKIEGVLRVRRIYENN